MSRQPATRVISYSPAMRRFRITMMVGAVVWLGLTLWIAL